jgi:hypothetical protein
VTYTRNSWFEQTVITWVAERPRRATVPLRRGDESLMRPNLTEIEAALSLYEERRKQLERWPLEPASMRYREFIEQLRSERPETRRRILESGLEPHVRELPPSETAERVLSAVIERCVNEIHLDQYSDLQAILERVDVKTDLLLLQRRARQDEHLVHCKIPRLTRQRPWDCFSVPESTCAAKLQGRWGASPPFHRRYSEPTSDERLVRLFQGAQRALDPGTVSYERRREPARGRNPKD